MALTLSACGSDSAGDTGADQPSSGASTAAKAKATQASGSETSKVVAVKVVNATSSEQTANAKFAEPDVQFPSGPPPKEIIIKDLREGSGPPAQEGDEMTIKFFCVNKDGKVVFSSWDKEGKPSATFVFGGGAYFPAWDQGVAGMKAGGRREIVFPEGVTGELGAVAYIVDLLKIK
jgi:peptidylprolyl isomerase